MERSDTILVALSPSPIRRGIAVVMQGGTGALLIYLALSAPKVAFFWQAFLIALGALAVWSAIKLWEATSHRLELTRELLRTSDGTVLCRLDDIASIDRGAFAFKPSNGFLIKLDRPAGPRHWAPGLWWRTRSRIGVGGVTPSAQSKIMAEVIAELMAQSTR